MSTPQRTATYYDANADVYDQKSGFGWDSGHAYNFRRYYEPFLQRAVPSTGRVLELGCGTGFYTKWLENRGLEIVAMDISPNMIEHARRRCRDVPFFVGNCEQPEDSLRPEIIKRGFDAIIGINTFSYYSEKLAALKNYRTLLRDNGRLIFLDMNGTSYTQRLAYVLNHRGARQFRENVNESTCENLIRLFRETGFHVESINRFAFVPNSANRLMVMLLAPVDMVLARIPLVNAFAARISVVARKVED